MQSNQNSLDTVQAKGPEDELWTWLEQDALKRVLSSREGRRFVMFLLGKCGITLNPFTGQDSATNFNCGRHSVATTLIADIDAVDPDAYLIMQREHKEDKQYVNTIAANRRNNNGRGTSGNVNPASEFNSIAALTGGDSKQ